MITAPTTAAPMALATLKADWLVAEAPRPSVRLGFDWSVASESAASPRTTPRR